MATEKFTAVALPYSRAADAPFHVSIYIAPRLAPDGPEGELAEFPLFVSWADVLTGDTVIELRDQSGPIDIRPQLDPVDPALWKAVFPASTPVRGPASPDWRDRYWRTFRAAELHDMAKVLHVVAMTLDPTSPLAPDAHPLTGYFERLGGVVEGQRGYDERLITEYLDRELGETYAIADPRSLESIERSIGAAPPIEKFLLEMHRARRFYERPETLSEYSERPIPGAQLARPPRPGPDFHERVSMVGDHPLLQRALGLVLDVIVDDLPRLGTAQWLSASLTPAGDGAVGQRSRTRCKAVGDAVVTVASTPDWRNGRLRLGIQDRFAVLDMDPDGTALKLDRYLPTLPRLAAAARNGDPVHAAPTALRSIGLTVVRNLSAMTTAERMDRQHQLEATVGANSQPELFTEDVTHGMRVEVWDDSTSTWYSLHRRLIDVEVLDHGQVLAAAAEEGFIQGTTATEAPGVAKSPVHIHEALFGWDGWSLSAARPGKRVRHQDGEEIVEDPETDPDPVTPLVIRPSVEPGTLPRLRYGRSYAFRVWAADLAGNSRPHTIGPVPEPPQPLLGAAVAAAANTRAIVSRAGDALVELRSQTAAGVLRTRMTDVGGASRAIGPIDEMPELEPLLAAGLDRAVLARVETRFRDRVGGAPAVVTDRAAAVSAAFADSILDERQPFLVATASVDPRVIASGIHEFGRGAGPGVGAAPADSDALAELDTISPLVPFLRWNPIAPPAIVARHAYTPGESLRQVVIRSGITQDLETLALTITSPADYAMARADLGYHGTSERHFAAPKTSQSEAELHGAFDDAIGSTDPDVHRRLLGVALREAGTLFDIDVPRLDDPNQRDPQPGIALLAGPETPIAELESLPLPLGDAPFPGQYIVHDTDELRLPYLPDVLARGISLVFPDAGRDRMLGFPFGTEGFTARYEGDWPEPAPFRLVLHGTPALEGRLDATVLQIGLPAADVQRFRLASSLDHADLELLGLWRILPPAVRTNSDVIEAAADGWLWAFTPFDDVTLVHAVPRPLEVPRVVTMVPRRLEGEVDVAFTGAVDLHGPSTESVTVECRWSDTVDDTSLSRHHVTDQRGVAFTTAVGPTEDIAVLLGRAPDATVPIPGYGPISVHRAVHPIGDTKHHTVHYRYRATTRFREYFDPTELVPGVDPPADPLDPGAPVDDGRSVVGPELTIEVPSSARPAAPIVHSVLPLFRWDEGPEPEQPVATRRRRRAGVRIYLERPWFSSGDGELVGVVLAPLGRDADLPGLVSQWGADPLWISAPVAHRAVLGIDNLMHIFGFDDRVADAGPVRQPVDLPLAAVDGAPMVTVLGYQPQYNEDRRLWYVDIALDPGASFWPFVRLSIVRYQPDSIDGCHLSKPTLCDFVQLTPERTTSISRTDDRHVRVVVSGPIGVRFAPAGSSNERLPTTPADLGRWLAVNRKVVARLQRRDPAIPTDLGWTTVDATELTVRGHGGNVFEAAWVGSLESDEVVPLHRPGGNDEWRVTVEEWERLPGDTRDLGLFFQRPVWEQRLVYADELHL